MNDTQTPTDRPNVILINCDDLGYGDIACYGSKVNKTPNLDAMARRGIRFTDYHVMAPVCSASRAALLTGCYPQRLGLGIQGRRENRHKRKPLPLMRGEEVIQEQPDQRGLTERYTEECVRFIRDNAHGPFFLYLAHMYVHVPLFVPHRFLRQAANGPYGGAVECIDWAAGVIFFELQRLGIDENTIVIFTSDNGSSAGDGGGSNAPLRGTKFTTWEGGQRVPFIIRWPGKIPAGETCDELVTAMDLMPTLARIAGASEPRGRTIDGKDISPLIFGEEGATSPHEGMYYYRLDYLEAVRKGKWKLHFARIRDKVFAKGEQIPPELYDLESDIAESINVADEHPEIVRDLLAEADKARQELGDGMAGAEGAGCRPVGLAENPKPLTHYDENHPYIVAFYDTRDEKATWRSLTGRDSQ